jgi:peptide-N4-(N-acetyl-beta-glucosaminyl)asparagine amidase
MGFEARHIGDWTDHVWTEVWSEERSEWLHADPCENKLDKPKL